MEKILKDFSEDIRSVTRGGRKRMRAVFARMKKRQDKFLKRTKLKKGSSSRITEGNTTSTNESAGGLQSDDQSSSTFYLSIDTEGGEDGLNPNSSELHQTEDDDLSPQITITAGNDDPHSDVVHPPPLILPDTDDKETSFTEEKTSPNNDPEDPEANHIRSSEHSTHRKFTAEQIFVMANFILEVPTAIFDQLSSEHRVHYALLSMLMSMATMIISFSELVYKGRRERVAWKWKREKKIMPWLYYPAPSNKPFGSAIDFIGVSCSISQCIFTAAAYACYSRHTNNPIKISTWPLIFSFGLLCSKLVENQNPHKRMFKS